MDLQIGGDEEPIIDSARKFLATEWPIGGVRGSKSPTFDRTVRQSFAEMGWLGMGLPEVLGGAGFGPVEEALFYREMGRGLGPTAALSIALAARIGLEDRNLLGELLAGEHAVAYCVGGTATVSGKMLRGSFRAIDVAHAAYAIYISDNRALLFELGSATVNVRPCLDKSVSMAEVTVQSARICGSVPSGAVTSIGRLYVAAMLIGICEAVTVMLVEYAKLRETFGRPIGAYQAVRHPCADMAVRNEAARAQLFYASVALRDGHADAALHVNAAKQLANAAALLNVDACIQLHGGIGTTDEHNAHLFMKRAHVLSRWLGADRTLVQQILSAPTHA